MSKKFYIATALERAADHKFIKEALIAAGHEITYDWTTHGSVQDKPHTWCDVAQNEINGVIDADVVIVLLPGGRGTHTELGIALGNATPIIIVGDQVDATGRTCIFYHDTTVRRVSDALLTKGYAMTDFLELFKEV